MDVIEVGVRNLTQHVTHVLGRAIVQGKYDATGSLPTEADLSSEFNTSRSVTREAVKMLTAKGLIASRPRQGIKIQPKHTWNLFDTDVLSWLSFASQSSGGQGSALLEEFAQLRWAIEPEAAALAARFGSRDKIHGIDTAVAVLETFLQNNQPPPLEAEVAFHLAILAASGNRFFSQFGEVIHTALAATFDLRARNTTPPQNLYRRVYDAIFQGRQQDGRTAVYELLISERVTLSASTSTPQIAVPI